MTAITRRNVVTGAAATSAASAADAIVPRPATADDDADMNTFLDISVALTGIAKGKLAPALDPIGISRVYFKQAKADAAFADLLTRWQTRPVSTGAEIFFQRHDSVFYLARNIMIAWYLGAWSDPAELKRYDTPN